MCIIRSESLSVAEMEWRERSAVSCDDAFLEAQRWVEAVTKKTFGSNNFRSALENGVLLCDLINRIKPGIIKRVNRLSTPIAGLDNVNVFLKACGKLGLKEAQLFHPGDLQDLSTRVTVKRQETSRRLKNVLITIYWLGRKAQSDPFYNGPYLNLKAFEGLLGIALSKALEDSFSSPRGSSVRDSGFGDSWYSEREDLFPLRGGGHRREDSLDSLDSLGSRPHSISSDTTLKGSSEGCCSDVEAESVFRMAENKDSLQYRRSLGVAPKTTTQFNQFLPSKDKATAYVPAPLRKKRAERHEDNRRSWASPMYTEEDGTFTSETRPRSTSYDNELVSQSSLPAAHLQWAYEYESGSDSDQERPDPDLVLDDLASRRFHSPSPAPPTNFALPISPLEAGGAVTLGRGGTSPMVTVTANASPRQTVTCLSSSGGPLASPSPQHGLVRVDHLRPRSADSLLREMYYDSEDDEDDVGYADPVQDDLYARKVGVSPQPPANVPYDRFLPKFWTPEEDVHVQKIKLGSQRRPWYKKIQGFSRKKSGSSSDESDCDITPWLSSAASPSGPSPSHSHAPEVFTHTAHHAGQRLLQNRDDSDGSKSMTDITEDQAALKQVRSEELQKVREKVKESDDQWQDDLTKWKNRRKSVNSDIVKKKEEREQTEIVTSGSGRRSRTFKEMQEGREKGSIGSRLSSLSLLDQDVFEDPTPVPAPVPRTRTLPARSYTIDTPYTPVDRPTAPSEPPLRKEDPPTAFKETKRAASPPPTTQRVDRVDIPAGSDDTTTPSSRTSIYNPHSTTQAPMERSTSPALEHTSTAKKEEASTTPSSVPKVPEPRRPWAGKLDEEVAPSSGSLYKQPQNNSMESRPPGVSRVSASLPRSYQRSDSARLTSVVTPRPFGTQSTRMVSLPRAYTMDDSHKRVNGGVDSSKKPSVPSRYSQVMTSEDEARSHSSSAHSSNEEDEEDEEEEEKGRGVTPPQKVSPVPPPRSEPLIPLLPKAVSPVPVSPAPVKDAHQESYSDMRISLNQKPNSSRDFGFHADWDSTGAHVTSIQPGSPAEQCQLQVGDEVLAVSGHKVADMSYDEWERSMEESLQQGSLGMDIRRHGRNRSPDPATVNTSLDFTSRKPTETTLTAKEVASYPIIDVSSNGMNGGFRDESVTIRNKDSEPMSLKNLKRRSEFFEQGGSESAISDLAVPSIAPSSARWNWDPEEERRRQEKWQREQELLLQEKYKRDQEKLEEEWRKAQREAVTVGSRHHPEEQERVEVHSRSISPLSPLNQPAAPWEDREVAQEEERRRREQEEQQRQEEERRKRDEEERELLRLQEERKRREKLEEEERKTREEEELKWQRRREEEREEERRRQEATEHQRRERERALEQQQGVGDSHGYARHELSMADRAKSKSTPELDDTEKPQTKGWYSRGGGMAERLLEEELMRKRNRKDQLQRAASELELERRNILNAMRYRQPERVASSGLSEASSWGRKGQGPSQAEQERQQILREMKKKTHLTTDNSWIRQRSTSTTTSKEPEGLAALIRRGESLDNLDVPRSSWRSSWTPGSTSSIPNYSRPHSALSGNTSSYGGGYSGRPGSATLPSSLSMSSLKQGGGNPSSWSQRSPSPSSPSPTPSPGPGPSEDSPESRPSSQQRSRSVSGKKICTFCDTPLGKGAAMIIESLGLCYHLTCFKCIDCKCDLGGSEAGAEVRIRSRQLYCNSCYMRFKVGQPTSM